MALSKKHQSLGVPFEDDDGEGIIYCGKKQYRSKKGSKIIRGEKYSPSGCSCGLPPWELCDPECEYRIK